MESEAEGMVQGGITMIDIDFCCYRHGTNLCMKITPDKPLGNDPWLIALQKASALLESTARTLASGGHTFFTAQVKEIRDEINEQIQGEKEWLGKE